MPPPTPPPSAPPAPLTPPFAPAALPVAFSHAVALAFHRGEQGTVPWYDAPRVVRSRVADCLDAGPLYRQLLPGPCSVVVVDPDGYHPAECALLGEVMRHAPPEVEFAVFSPEGGGGDSPAPASRSWELHAVAADRAGHSSLGSAGGAAFLQEALDRRAGGVGAGAGDVWTRVDVRSGLVSGRGVVLDTEADEVDWIAQHVCRLLDEGVGRAQTGSPPAPMRTHWGVLPSPPLRSRCTHRPLAGAHPHDVAVLTPRFGDASRVADALSQRHGVGTESADDFATPLKTPHGRAVLDLLRLACDPHDPRVVASLATSPVVGLHPSLLARVALQPRHRATSLASIVHAMGDPASRVPRPARCDEATWQAFRARCGAFSGLLSLAESLSDGTRSAADAAAALLRASGLQDDTTGAMSRALWAVQAAGEAAGSDSVGAVLPYASALASLPRGDALLAEGPGPSRVLAVDGEMRPRAGLSAVHVGTLHGAQHAAFRHVVLARARTTSLPGPRPAAQLWLPGEDATATAHRRHETAALSRVLGGADGSVVATVARKYPSLAREQALAQVLGPLLAGGVHHRPGPVIQARDNDCSDSSTLNASSKAQRSGGGPLVSTPAAAEGGGVAAEAAAGNEQLRLSVSRVNEYRRCPRAYFFARVLRLPTEPNPLLTYGSHVHGGVELFWWLAARSVLADAGPLSEAEALERVLARTRAAWEAPDTLRAFGDPASTDKALGRAEQVLRAFVARQYRSDVAPDQGAGLFTWLTAAQGADSGRKRIALPEQPFTVPMDRVDAHLNGVWDLLLIDAPVDGSAATQAMESELLGASRRPGLATACSLHPLFVRRHCRTGDCAARGRRRTHGDQRERCTRGGRRGGGGGGDCGRVGGRPSAAPRWLAGASRLPVPRRPRGGDGVQVQPHGQHPQRGRALGQAVQPAGARLRGRAAHAGACPGRPHVGVQHRDGGGVQLSRGGGGSGAGRAQRGARAAPSRGRPGTVPAQAARQARQRDCQRGAGRARDRLRAYAQLQRLRLLRLLRQLRCQRRTAVGEPCVTAVRPQ